MKAKGEVILVACFVAFLASVFYYNITTFNSLKKHTAYAVGEIIEVWDDDGTAYCRYRYTVNKVAFTGLQGDRRAVADTVLIVYDSLHPKFSMIARYPTTIVVDSSNTLKYLDTSLVTFQWLDYLPGDKINSIGDLWN